MLEAQVRALEVRRRLFNPPKGVVSSELDILSAPSLRQKWREDSLARRVAVLTDIVAEQRVEISALRGKLATADNQIANYCALLAGSVAEKHIEDQENPARLAEPELFGTPRFRIKQIVHVVASHFGISVQGLLSKQKVGRLASARFVLYQLSYELTGLSLSAVGRALGRDHTTILYGIQKVKTGDSELKSHVAVVKEKLGMMP